MQTKLLHAEGVDEVVSQGLVVAEVLVGGADEGEDVTQEGGSKWSRMSDND